LEQVLAAKAPQSLSFMIGRKTSTTSSKIKMILNQFWPLYKMSLPDKMVGHNSCLIEKMMTFIMGYIFSFGNKLN
jgi:hypothetical protein